MVLTFAMAEQSTGAAVKSSSYGKNHVFTISGKIIKKEERWDRRGNPLMGRPDFLKEIIFHIHVNSAIQGKVPGNLNPITVSVKGQKGLIKYNKISEGQKGIFTLSGDAMPFFLIEAVMQPEADHLPGAEERKEPFANGSKENNTAIHTGQKKIDPMTLTDDEFLANIEKISGRQIKESPPLQQRASHVIAKKYGMLNAEVIILVSFSGPAPPNGGYVYWGVRGQIGGKWHVWQPWTNWIIREGSDLEDPKRYQKCISPQTKILTAAGYAAVSDLKVGDMLITETGRFVPVLTISRAKVTNHHVSRVQFDNGTIVEISPTHPLADGRFIGQLKPGDEVGQMRVIKAELVIYEFEYTYDILPDSPSGNYYADGILLKSTLSITK